MKTTARIIIPALLTLLLVPSGVWADKKSPTTSGPAISRITLRTSDIFNTETSPFLNHFPYSWINVLHIQTKTQVIRNELLFKVGDHLDPYLLKETVRNLRALPFIRAARIATFPQRDGTVAVVVYAADAWTTEPQMNLGRTGGGNTMEVGFKEKNLFGYGKNIEYFIKKTPDYLERRLEYFDPRFLNTRWQLTGGYIIRTHGDEKNLVLNRPYFSADTRFSSRIALNQSNDVIEARDNNVKVSEFELKKTNQEIYMGSKIGGGRTVVTHLGPRFKEEKTEYFQTDNTSPSHPIPDDTVYKTLFADLDITRNRFIELTRVNKMIRVEDFNLGPKFTLSPGYSPHQFTGTKDTTHLESTYEHNLLFQDTNFLTTKIFYGGRDILREGQNKIMNLDGTYYYREKNWHTLVVHSRAEWGANLDADNQVILGGDNGLRAYKRDEFSGAKGWLLNIEDRYYFGDEIAELFALGGVLFYDTGYVWPRGKTPAITDLQSAIGAGLRIALTKASSEAILRFDVAYRMQRPPSSDKTDHWVITFGSSQAF